MIRPLVPALLAVAMFPAAAHAGMQTQAKAADQACAFTVGWEVSDPFYIKDTDGTVRGLDADIARLVAGRAGCTVDFKEQPWSLILTDIMEGKLAAVMGATRTHQRDTFARFTTPYRQEAMALVVPKAAKTKTLAGALKTGSVGVVIGYEYGPKIKAALAAKETGPKFDAGPNDDENLKKLADGRLAGAIVNPYVAATHIKALGLEDKLKVVAPPIGATPVKIMVSKKADKTLYPKLEQALESLKAEGTLDIILGAYGS